MPQYWAITLKNVVSLAYLYPIKGLIKSSLQIFSHVKLLGVGFVFR